MQQRRKIARKKKGRPKSRPDAYELSVRRTAARPVIARLRDDGCLVNLAGDYRYLTAGYYRSQDLVSDGGNAHPTCQEAIDAYVAPLFLEKAAIAGLPIPEYYLTNEHFDPPVVIDTVNPFPAHASLVLKNGHTERMTKSLTRNYTYAICCQTLPPGARIAKFRAVLGWTRSPRYRPIAEAIWRVYRLPLALVRVIVQQDSKVLFSALGPLPFASLTKPEQVYLRKVVEWPT